MSYYAVGHIVLNLIIGRGWWWSSWNDVWFEDGFYNIYIILYLLHQTKGTPSVY